MESRRLKLTAFSFLIFILLSIQTLLAAQEFISRKEMQVGVILDMGSGVGKVIYRSISMAISDFYAANPHYKTLIVLHTRDTKGEPLLALSAGEKLQSNLSRFVVMVWVFVALVLSSSYTATLSSLLTVQQIASKGGLVEFQGNSPVGETIFNNLKGSDGIIEPLYSPQDYVNALRSGKVGAIIDEIFYIKTVIGLYPVDEFSLVATSSTTNGFAFAFQKGSPLTKDMSAEIAKLRADGTLKALEDKWLKRQFSMMSKDLSAPSPTILNLHRFRGLFLISGLSMALAFLVSLVYLVREKCNGKRKMEILRCILPTSVQVHALENDVEPAV